MLRLLKLTSIMILAIVTQGCASPYKRMKSLSISTNFSSAEIEVIVQAADDWCKRKESLCIPVVISNSRSGGSIQKSPEIKCVEGFSGTTVLSAFHAPRIHICRELSLFDLYWLARHELGHAFGLKKDHLPKGNTMNVSFPDEDDDPGITEKDLKYVTI